jgi:glycosyltransferase involved in cell wall biosynthesis
MRQPLVSILLPVYNCEGYIVPCIESLLTQTYPHFELLIINDGSTDNTQNLIETFKDDRIIYVKNKQNNGLIYTLNKGIQLAKGKYIARMDGDDIALASRLEMQVNYMESFDRVAVLATVITCIDTDGKLSPSWPDDEMNTEPAAIKKTMAWRNCIAHPTVMMRTNLAQQFLYNPVQKNIEDYDLWLRYLSNGHVIAKLKEPQLLYRIHPNSITGSILSKYNPYFKQAACKYRFLKTQIAAKKINRFVLKIFGTMILDCCKGLIKQLKNKVQ